MKIILFGLKNNDEEFNCLPCIYWLPKMHKIPCDARFITNGKKCINKQLSKYVKSAFKQCYRQIDAYHKKSILFQWDENLDISTLCTRTSHVKLLDIFYKVVDFVFKGDTRDYIAIKKQGCASWSSKKRGHHFVFNKSLPKEAIKFLYITAFSVLEIL